MFRKRKKDTDRPSNMDKEPGFPSKELKDAKSIGLSEKSLKNLPRSSYAVQADPYTATLPTAKPYPIIAKNNRKFGGNYAGERNLDGGNASQYCNSPKSGLLAYADYMKTTNLTNYRMLPLNLRYQPKVSNSDYAGQLLVDEMRKSISETTSILQSTTFTQMPIYNYAVITDMPMGSATPTQITLPDGTTANAYLNLNDVIYASTIFYQLVMQSGLQLLSQHDAFRLKMGQMLRRSWNRETPILNSYFGEFKRSSFLSFINSLGMSFEGEWIDRDEFKQLNMLTLVPSCRSEALTDPMKEVILKLVVPDTFKLVIMTDTTQGQEAGYVFFDKDSVGDDGLGVVYKTSGTTTANGNYFDLINTVIDQWSAESTAAWARDPQTNASSGGARYNRIKWMIDGVQLALTHFKTAIADIREIFETMARTGAINWSKGYIHHYVEDTDADAIDNMIINDIYRIKGSTAPDVTLDVATKRWRTFTLWNMYDGIPEFDAYQGGAFLTLSLKQINFASDQDDIHKYLPIRFVASDTPSDDYFYAISRDGKELVIESNNVVQMSTDAVLSRLAPLPSQASLTIKVPKLQSNYRDTQIAVDTIHKSTMYKTLVQVFGLSQVVLVNNTDIAIDPDVIAIYQIELQDITNAAITYARANAPFRGTSSDADILGFAQGKISKENW